MPGAAARTTALPTHLPFAPSWMVDSAGVPPRKSASNPRVSRPPLNGHPDVAESLVRGVEDPDGERHLVADVAVSPEGADAREPGLTGRLRTHLERALPRFMVPDSFVLLDKLPRSSRGKLDFAALPVPDFGCSRSKPPFVAPRNEVEGALAQIWKQVLQMERVGVDDDLLQIGGDSLSATRIVSRVNHVFGANLSLRAIFDAPTIASLAALLYEHTSSLRMRRQRGRPIPAPRASVSVWSAPGMISNRGLTSTTSLSSFGATVR